MAAEGQSVRVAAGRWVESCPSPWTVLRKGERGEDAEALRGRPGAEPGEGPLRTAQWGPVASPSELRSGRLSSSTQRPGGQHDKDR
ncbi:unnamed protein product [Rangifer tarandus platyrhynchus]|uniref:Uncharacterized protein n=1 Tax=Rangifer tarandus platyrhynchus TaxID=3082113 RepID=A0AC59ZSC0_RANTA